MKNKDMYQMADEFVRLEFSGDDEGVPEEVRTYLREIHGQVREEGGGNRLTLKADNLPGFVREWLRGALAERSEKARKDPGAMTVRELSPQLLRGFWKEALPKVHGEIYGTSADDPVMKGAAGALLVIWDALARSDKDWGALRAETAQRLFLGVAIGYFGIVRAAAKEAGHDAE